MASHQIIYTSCKRGISGTADGQQIFSYDSGFAQSHEKVLSMLHYETPDLPPGAIMNEEYVSMQPVTFAHRHFEDGSSAFVLNTYLGHDYMGPTGRFGNFLSHCILCDSDEAGVYPCEFYNSEMFRTSMDFDEVNNPEPPEFLPEPEIISGEDINLDVVSEFLCEDDNLSYYRKMLAALLKYPDEKKKIIICDDQDRIIKWIAALTYSLPVEFAEKINFSTYDYNPEMSYAHICGVVKRGTDYDYEEYLSSGRYYIFDFQNDCFAMPEDQEPYIDFLASYMTSDYTEIYNFNVFVTSSTDCSAADESLYSAYLFYCTYMSGCEQITDDFEIFRISLDFSSAHVSAEIRKEFSESVMSHSDVILGADENFTICYLRYLIKVYDCLEPDYQEYIGQIFTHMICSSLINYDSYNEFSEFYSKVSEILENSGTDIMSYIAGSSMILDTIRCIGDAYAFWKAEYLLDILGKCLDTEGLDLLCEGSFLAVLNGMMYDSGKSDLPMYFTSMFYKFSERGVLSSDVMFFTEAQYLRKDENMNAVGKVIGELWNAYIAAVNEFETPQVMRIMLELLEKNHFDTCYDLYRFRTEHTESISEIRDFFMSHVKYCVLQYGMYSERYFTKIYDSYYEKFTEKNTQLTASEYNDYIREMLETAVKYGAESDKTSEILSLYSEGIDAKTLTEDDKNFISQMMEGYTGRLKLNEKLASIFAGISFEKCSDGDDITSVTTALLRKYGKHGIDLWCLEESKSEDSYISWIYDSFIRCSLNENQYMAVYNIYSMSAHIKNVFMLEGCKRTLAQSMNSDYEMFRRFLVFMFSFGEENYSEKLGEYIANNLSAETEIINERMTEIFSGDSSCLESWGTVINYVKKNKSIFGKIMKKI